jgi:hypothetical protein
VRIDEITNAADNFKKDQSLAMTPAGSALKNVVTRAE